MRKKIVKCHKNLKSFRHIKITICSKTFIFDFKDDFDLRKF